MSLYNEVRPTSFKQVKGNTDIISTLENMLANKTTFPHAVLFHGETGSGKTTLARIVKDSLGCVGGDYMEMDSAQFNGVDTIRDIRLNMGYSPLEGDVRVWVLDEVHRLTAQAQDAALKMLEDTPPHVYFILCTTEPNKLAAAVRNRCSQFQLKPLSDPQMIGLLKATAKVKKQVIEEDVLNQIVTDSLGRPRDALQILEQVLQTDPDKRLSIAKKTAEQQSQVIELCRVLIGNGSWKQVSSILVGLKDQEPEGIRRMVLGYCQSVLLKAENNQAAAIMEVFWEPMYNIGFPGVVFNCYKIIKGE